MVNTRPSRHGLFPFDLVAVDLDGTLVRDDGAVSPRTERALRALRRLGVTLVVCTGRGPVPLKTISPVLDGDNYRAFVNGAMIYHREALVRLTALEREDLERIADFFARHEVSWLVNSVSGTRYCQPIREDNEARESILAWTEGRVRYVESLEDLGDDVPLRISTWNSRRVIDRLHGLMLREGWGDLNIYRAHFEFSILEVLPAEARKDRALAWIAERLGVPSERVLAFDDGENDAGMLRWAGCGVAMANAAGDARAAADILAPSNEEDGVATILERFLASPRGEWWGQDLERPGSS